MDEIYLYSMEGKQLTRLAPDFVGATEVAGRRAQSNFFALLTGFTNPGIVARYNFDEPSEEKRWSIYRSTTMSGLVPDEFSAEQVWYKSKDGTKVPMFIVKHKSTKSDGTAPAIQYGEISILSLDQHLTLFPRLRWIQYINKPLVQSYYPDFHQDVRCSFCFGQYSRRR
jgi:prolyl oligopeptidase PreP (S9A serine peptidase family)